MSSNYLILCHPLLLLPSVFPRIRVFSNELALHIRWPEYWSFSFSISPSNEYSGLISLRMDWLDLLAVQGTLKSLIQHHHSKALILQCSVFFMVQHLHPYMITGKTIALTRRSFISKVMSLLLNMLSRLVTICSDFGAQKNKVWHCFHCFPISGRVCWMASRTQCTWVWVNSGSWWWTGRPGVLQFMGSQRVGYNWVTELNWKNPHTH